MRISHVVVSVLPLVTGCRNILGIGDRQLAPDASSSCRAPAPPGQAPAVGVTPTFTAVSGGISAPALTAGFVEGAAFDLDDDQDSDLFLLDTDFSDMMNPAHLVIWRASSGKYSDASAVLGTPLLLNEPSEALAFDATGDGRDDVFVGQAANMAASEPAMFLFVQQKDSTLMDEASTLLVPSTLPGMYFSSGAAVADVNCDGAMDLLQTRPYDQPVLRINDGHGTLTEDSRALPMDADPLSANVFCDINRDGAPDLYVGGCGGGCGKQPDALFLNDGFGKFSEAPAGSLPANPTGYPIHAACVDVDLDGWPDLVVANADQSNSAIVLSYWRNRGDGTFEDATSSVEQPWGTATLFLPRLAVADFNRDGWPDLLVSSVAGNLSVVMVNRGGSLAKGPTFALNAAFAVEADLDGKTDLVTMGGSGPGFQAVLYRNTTP